MRCTLDMALALLAQQNHLQQSSAARYWWADSSPMLGRSWLCLQERRIEELVVVTAMQLAHQLIRFSQGLKHDADVEVICSESIVTASQH